MDAYQTESNILYTNKKRFKKNRFTVYDNTFYKYLFSINENNIQRYCKRRRNKINTYCALPIYIFIS